MRVVPRFYAFPARVALVASAVATAACGTVDLGSYQGVRDVQPDEDFYYCVIQPQVITPQKCASGDSSAGDGSSDCHSSQSAMILVDIPTPVTCANGKATGTPSVGERSNFQAASLRVTRDVEGSPILARPTGVQPHPRVIFASNSAEADLLRTWIQGAR